MAANQGILCLFSGGPYHGERRMVHQSLFDKGVIIMPSRESSWTRSFDDRVTGVPITHAYKIRMEHGGYVSVDDAFVFDFVRRK